MIGAGLITALLGLAATGLVFVLVASPRSDRVLVVLAWLLIAGCGVLLVAVLIRPFVTLVPEWFDEFASAQSTKLAAGFSVLFIVASACVVFARLSYIRLKNVGAVVPGLLRGMFLLFAATTRSSAGLCWR